MVIVPFLPERSGLPALHSGCGDGNPVDASCFVRNVAAYLLQTFSSKQLARPGDVVLAFKTVLRRIVTACSQQRCTGHAQIRNLNKLLQEKLQIVLLLKSYVCIKITDDLIRQRGNPFKSGIDAMSLGSKAPITVTGHIQPLDPVMRGRVTVDDRRSRIRRTIVHNHPFHRMNVLADNRLDGSFQVALFVPGGCDQDPAGQTHVHARASGAASIDSPGPTSLSGRARPWRNCRNISSIIAAVSRISRLEMG